MRRLVAGPDETGKTRILFDGEAAHRVVHAGTGLDWTQLWSTDDSPPAVAAPLQDPTRDIVEYFPPPAATRFMVNRIPSAAERRRREATARADDHARFQAQAPGMAETMEPAGHGMHTSRTIDYGLILDGEIDIEFDDGVRQRLRAGDAYVLHEARHNWHALEDVGCTIAVVLIGVRSEPEK